MTNFEENPTVKELKKTYNAQDLDVQLFPTREECISFLRRTSKDATSKVLVGEDFLGMAFCPPTQTKDGKPHIAVDLSKFPEAEVNEFKNTLTHEFSNYEAWRRWGKEIDEFMKRVEEYVNSVIQGYLERPIRRYEPDPSVTFYRMVKTFIYDSVVSVPADFVTAEKFNQRLLERKGGKLIGWSEQAKKHRDKMQDTFLVTFPYLAYLTFHPTKRKYEESLEKNLSTYWKASNINSEGGLQVMRRVREYLHGIRIPVSSDNLFSTYLDIESYWCKCIKGD